MKDEISYEDLVEVVRMFEDASVPDDDVWVYDFERRKWVNYVNGSEVIESGQGSGELPIP